MPYRVLVIGAGPVGLFVGSCFKVNGHFVTIQEKRVEFCNRKRHLTLQLLKDYFDHELFEKLQKDFNGMLDGLLPKIRNFLEILCSQSALPLNILQEQIIDTFDLRSEISIKEKKIEDFNTLISSYDLVVDCTGYRSPFTYLLPRKEMVAEKVAIVSFDLTSLAQCNSQCKLEKNRGNRYFLIPYLDGIHPIYETPSDTHATAIIHLSEDEYETLKGIRSLEDIRILNARLYEDINRFLGRYPMNSVRNISCICIPLNFYSVNQPSLQNFVQIGDSAMGSPYFQSITNGIISAVVLSHFVQNNSGIGVALQNFDDFYKQHESYISMKTTNLAAKRKRDLKFLQSAQKNGDEIVRFCLKEISHSILNMSIVD